MIFKPFEPAHLKDLVLQPAQASAYADFADKGYGDALAQHEAYTGFVDGRVVACAGVVPIWRGRGELWALIARDIGKIGMHSLHYSVRIWLSRSAYRRLEAHCDAAFLQAHRWLRLLDFEYEGPLRAYTPDGRDCLRFARVK
jgi:RimJ/RimL family protein N-acetyltransferase